MRFNIITNLTNGVGLQQDYESLRAELLARGHEVNGVMWNATTAPEADVNIFLELVQPNVIKFAKEQWAVPNPEWWYRHIWDKLLPDFRWVLAKTRDCERIFKAKVGTRCRRIGWKARDLWRPEIKREKKFLHLAGKSSAKNTEAVFEAWKHIDIPLTVISVNYRPQRQANIQWFNRVDEPTLIELMNSHQFHICPSAYEGYGHALHEARGVGAVVIATNQPPMNECGAILVQASGSIPTHAARLFKVQPPSITRAVNTALALSDADITAISMRARGQYEAECRDFDAELDALFGAKTIDGRNCGVGLHQPSSRFV